MKTHVIVISMLGVLLFAGGLARAELLFFEDFENAPTNQPYPWNGTNSDNFYTWAYNRAVPISEFQEHNRSFLGNNVLYLEHAESYHLFPSQTIPVKFEYDLLFHYSEQSPVGYGANFGQSIIVNKRDPRGGIIGLRMQKGYSAEEDGIYWSEVFANNYRIGDIIPDTWYHVERTINPANQTDTIKLTNRDTLQEFNFVYEINTLINSIDGFTLAVAYSPSYSLIDNLVISTVPEPSTIIFMVVGILGVSQLKR